VNARPFLVYAIATSLLEQAALLVVLLIVLPEFGVVAPAWFVVAAALALVAVSVGLTRLNLKAIALRPACSPDVGVRGRVVRALMPRGYVRVGNELWPAVSEGGSIAAGAPVVVTRMERFRLVVAPAADDE
jgi:membrane-bound ClpP family serine protease